MSPISAENRRRYPRDWRQISNRIRFDRAKEQCECEGECSIDHAGRCPARHLRKHPITGSTVVLTVAHLDHQPENCDDANLRAMCQRCHLTYDGEHHARNAARSRARRATADMEPLL